MTTRTIAIDKIYHISVSYALVLTAHLVLPLALAVAFAFAVGVIKELCDYADYGLFDVKDLLADAVGIGAGVLIIYLCGLLESAI